MRVAILGLGNMGKAIASGLLSNLGNDVSVIGYDKIDTVVNNFPGVTLRPVSEWASEKIDAVIIGVKPPDVAEALSQWKEKPCGFDPIWISIAAGIPIAALEKSLYRGARIIRVMPNTPAVVSRALSAFCPNVHCRNADIALAEKILSSFGMALQVPEKLLNAVTGLSGSGPAYVYLFIEALIEAGIAVGLPHEVARKSAIQTVIGSAVMLEKTGKSASELKFSVMSPAGTTARGLAVLEEKAFKSAVIGAVAAATQRAEELGKA